MAMFRKKKLAIEQEETSSIVNYANKMNDSLFIAKDFGLTEPTEVHIHTVFVPREGGRVSDYSFGFTKSKSFKAASESDGLNLSLEASTEVTQAAELIFKFIVNDRGISLDKPVTPTTEMIAPNYLQLTPRGGMQDKDILEALLKAKELFQNDKKFTFWYLTPLKTSGKLQARMVTGYIHSVDEKARTFTLLGKTSSGAQYKTYAFDKVTNFLSDFDAYERPGAWLTYLFTPMTGGTKVESYIRNEGDAPIELDDVWLTADHTVTPNSFEESVVLEPAPVKTKKTSKTPAKSRIKQGDVIRMTLPNGAEVEARIERVIRPGLLMNIESEVA